MNIFYVHEKYSLVINKIGAELRSPKNRPTKVDHNNTTQIVIVL